MFSFDQISPITISDEDLDDPSIIFELCKCGANDVYDQTTLKIDTPDRTQNLLNQNRNLIIESSPRKENGNRWIDSDQNRTLQTECSSRNQSGIITSQSTLNQGTNLVTECSPRDLSDNQTPVSNQRPFCLPKYVIPIAKSRDPSEHLQLDSSQSARDQSANLYHEHHSTDQIDSKKPASDQSQSRYNIPEERYRDRSKRQPDMNQSARNRNTNLVYEHDSMDSKDNLNQSRNNVTEERLRKQRESQQPDLTQNTQNQSTGLVTEQSSRDQSGKQKRVSNQSRIKFNIQEANPREQNESVQPESSRNVRNKSIEYQKDNERTANRRQSKHNIPVVIPRERNVSLQPDSDQSDNNQSKSISDQSSKDQVDDHKTARNERYPSRYPIDKTSPRDLVIKLEKDQSRNSKNKTLDSLSEHIQAGTKRENPPEQSESLLNPGLEPDQLQPRANDQSKNDDEITKLSGINDGMGFKEEECVCRCDCENSSHDSQKYMSLEHLSKETTNNSENDKEKSAEQCQCKCLCQYSSYDPISISDTQKFMSLGHLPKDTTSKSEDDKEKTSKKSENANEKSAVECQCDPITIFDTQKRVSSEHFPKETNNKSEIEKTADECQCKCTCGETQLNDNSTVSVNQRWMITPEGILKGLEALKRSFLGQSEDHTSIWIDNIANRTRSYRSGNIQAELSSSLPKPSSETSHHRKTVTIKEPIRSDKCVYCDPSGSCEEDSDGCVSPKGDQETQKPERSDGSQGTESVFIVENAGMKWPKVVMKDSVQDSGGGSSCAGAREQYYRDKLLATLQVLENKEETIRVQGSSLAVAEDRIADLSKRASELRQELEHKARELNKTQQFADFRVDKNDVSNSAEIKEAETQKQVETLEDNLSTVIELYRECFYETAKQEELIDMLRKSYLDVRLMEKDKTERINRLQNVINTQKRSIEQCQDVVLEVENLKLEISSFLNSSNNDSGMWERGSESPDVGEELADILDQLRQLQQMLTSDCTCGLEDECSSLKERNKALEVELEHHKQRNNELDRALRQILDQEYEKRMKEKEREFQEVAKKMADVENTCKERSETCETLTRQLQQAQVMLDDKTAALVEARQKREEQDGTIRRLQQDLDKSDRLVEEGLKRLSEMAHSRTELLLESQARITELEQRLRHATRRCRDLEAECRERESCLEEAHMRGAKLCDESRRVAAGVKQWMREKKQLAREQQQKIKMQKLRICELERCVGARRDFCGLTSQSETDPSCSNSKQEHRLPCQTSYSRCSGLNPTCRSETTTFTRGPLAESIERERENETASCSKCTTNRQSACEMASCSRAPVPPRRKKRLPCDDTNYRHTSQPPRDRFEPCDHPDVRWARLYSRVRQASPTDEVSERVEHLHAALAAGQRRWGRQRR